MPLLSIITAVHAPSVRYLPAAYDSLLRQRLPGGWDWQWVIQGDGEDAAVAAAIPTNDSRVTYRAGPQAGPGVARTTALTRAEGQLVRNLDADDVLTDGALARDIDIMKEHPRVGWVASRVLDLHSDGSTSLWPHHDAPEGPIPQGWVLKRWVADRWLLPVHPTTLCLRRELLLAAGGWAALITDDDTALLTAAGAISVGYHQHTPSLLYRQHPDQLTRQPHHNHPTEKAARRKLIIDRAHALRAVLTPADPHPAGATHTARDRTGPW